LYFEAAEVLVAVTVTRNSTFLLFFLLAVGSSKRNAA
jgi:hypothetical protein